MDVKRLNDAAEEAADFLKALAAPGRLRVLCLLSTGEHSVTALAEAMGAPQPTISRHLTLLKKDGIVASRSSGTTRFYRLADRRVEKLMGVLYESFCEKTPHR
ncbi:metalloregulator ArsR/SmtB family transcription factor [uncultured Rhodoblastus sp.]|uniref:ArsR/SmtB family transcription factor n=1 Tax=uncultured Rhodoblastus sp. TaxID=543037 RepID=UPI0025EFB61E|nr:metalloregulator ArsR/SmtB family transcription factor [uncultured Rhodoblastus sp.]